MFWLEFVDKIMLFNKASDSFKNLCWMFMFLGSKTSVTKLMGHQ